MHLTGLWLRDFRCYQEAELQFPVGVTVICGANAQGKTSLLEAAAWAATGKSFRHVPDTALIREGADTAVVRAEVVEGERVQLLEAEIRAAGRNRVQLNRHALKRARDRVELMRVTVFAPDDLELVKGGPAARREYLDDLLVALSPRYEAARADYERVLRQRNALLRAGRGDGDAETTLAVFDDQLGRAGAELARGRVRLLERLAPTVANAYEELAGVGASVTATYEAEWAAGAVPDREAGGSRVTPVVDPDADLEGLLLSALRSRHRAERDRGVTLAGPHRDDLRLLVGGLESRTHASQGEQRTLALALRLGGHRLCADLTGSPPVLLLDDVFSELDERRAVALVAHLGGGQTLLTTAGSVPEGITPARTLRVASGRIEDAA
jgi:DNA replication and repair protein RecF